MPSGGPEKQKEYYQRNKERIKERVSAYRKRTKLANRLSQYDLTIEEYEKLLEQQEGCCAICQEPVDVIDHNHKTGETRGLLCRACNAGLGMFRDSTNLLLMACKYLER